MSDRPVVLLVGSLEPRLASHLIHALTDHQRWCRTNGIPWPPALNGLIEGLANGGQRRPTDAPVADGRDDESMLLTLDYQTAARRLSVSGRTVRRLVADGRLRAVTVGGSPRIRAADLAAYVDRLDDR